MKRRLNILCLAVMLVLSYSLIETTYYMILGLKAGTEVGLSNKLSEAEKMKYANIKHISLLPDLENHANFFPDSVYNEKSGSYELMAYGSMLVSIKAYPSIWMEKLPSLLLMLCSGLILWAFVLFIRLIVSINKSQIFNWKNVRRLRVLGFLLILIFGCSLLSEYITFSGVKEVFEIKDYKLILTDMVSFTDLLMGILSLIVGEVFAIGLRLKEEQELTI